MGIEFTPYSHILKRDKKDEELEHKILNENNSIFINDKRSSLLSNENGYRKKNNLLKILGSKVE